jgi:predicted nucleotidyltransferase component of viral defense system
MEAESLFANKLVALTQRKNIASRDLFDVHFFLKK